MKTIRICFVIAVAVMAGAGIISCKKKPEVKIIEVTGVQLDQTKVTVNVDSTFTLTATVLPADADNKAVTWSSSKPDVASVENGLITAKAKGSTSITVTTQDGNKTATCTVTVTKPHSAEPDMVLVEGGTFTMGCTDGECDSLNEKPTHQVTLSSFSISKREITQKQWIAIMGTNPSFNEGDSLPVERVTWLDVQEFIRRLNDSTGKQYRLPTEAEWEYAARGGTKSKGYKYSGGNDLNTVAWSSANSSSRTHEAGTKTPNELGIYDMSGNVAEWCSDWYDANYYAHSPQENPQGPLDNATPVPTNRVYRGGGSASTASFCRVSARKSDVPKYTNATIGFRLVLPQ